MVPERPCLEILVRSSEEARQAELAGADRVELCSALSLGGLTPSIGTARHTVAATPLPVVAMLRPRPGDFTFNAAEYEEICADLDAFLSAGVRGVVTGFLTDSGHIDTKRTADIVRRSGGVPVTFHRAFDLLEDLSGALTHLIDLGVRRILTSGGTTSAASGTDAMAQLRTQAAERVEIIAGGGLRARNVASIREGSKVTSFHSGPRKPQEGSHPGHPHLFGDVDILDIQEVMEIRKALST